MVIVKVFENVSFVKADLGHNRIIKDCICDTGHPRLIKLVGISGALTNFWIKAGVPKEKGLALHDAVNARQYSAVENRQTMRQVLGLPGHKKIVTYAGSLYKNREIESIFHLANIFPDALFLIVGGPEDRKLFYQEMCNTCSISNVLLTGRVSHHKVKQYLFAADVLLMIWARQVPTINYCSPLKMFEYMAAERIIVGHAFPTILEVLKNGEHAYLADPDSFDDLRNKMTLALNEVYPSIMAKNARELVMKQYTWKARAQAILGYL